MKAQLQSRCSTMPEDVQQLVQQITDSPSGRTTPSEVPAGAVGPKQRFKMPQAKDMRTEQSLTKTVEYLLKDIILDTRKPYNVVYDRLRAVRREIVIQMFDARQTIPSSCRSLLQIFTHAYNNKQLTVPAPYFRSLLARLLHRRPPHQHPTAPLACQS
ncbi:uncharacterized protein [Drosophila kikkawai]|uniref:Uncharacterized protein isoform X1 n=1 Tax=Drosophila kikkawai TaxID=30033 RepID=A0ABM4G9N5_DROKI|nr:uncharacterized protein LOC108081331 isoform X1 [Drosophila kikkawai]XP_041632101.1 uncharacterized protein LOC108081331 isoform X1 [Drosophila kikkawai]